MWLDLGPLKQHRDYRLLFFGQFVSSLGTMTSYVAVPYQIYEITKSPLLVGILGIIQLVPVLIFSLLGGVLADALNRKTLLWLSEVIMAIGAMGMAVNACLPNPQVGVIFALAFIVQAASSLHRPALEALRQSMVDPEEYAAMGALSAFQSSFTSIAGPALGGWMMAMSGAVSVYVFDALTYLIVMFCVLNMHIQGHRDSTSSVSLASIREGLLFAWQRPVLMGTYIVDIVAMTFAFPVALFPVMAKEWGGAHAAGVLYLAMSVGSLLISLISGRLTHFARRGVAVVLGAALWGVAVIALGFAPSLWWAFGLLALAGAADMVSALFRGVIWNEIIPNDMRGRLAGIEMISFLSGPLLGNLRAGLMAEQFGTSVSIWLGGIVCTMGVLICGVFLPAFWQYRYRAPLAD